MPVLPVSVIEPIWAQFSALLPDHPLVDPTHPLGCHRRRIPDRVIFDHMVAALVHGSGYERLATPGCSDRTIRRRVREWADAELMPTLHGLVLAQYDRMIGPELDEIAIDGCITKAPGGGEVAGRSPVDRGKLGLKRSVAVDTTGIPLGIVAAGANRHDSPLLAPTVATLETVGVEPTMTTIYLDRGYDNAGTRALLEEVGFAGVIARIGSAAPMQAGTRWVVERTHAWMNAYGKLRRCTERARSMVELYLFLAASIVTTHCLIRAARTRYRWDGRPTTRRLK